MFLQDCMSAQTHSTNDAITKSSSPFCEYSVGPPVAKGRKERSFLNPKLPLNLWHDWNLRHSIIH
jgi:hypothetical protein